MTNKPTPETDATQPNSSSSIKNLFNQIPSILNKKGVKYEKGETDYTSGAIKHSICYSFTIDGEEFEIEEFEYNSGKKFLTANIDSDPNGDEDDAFSYKMYDDYNMDDFIQRVLRALKAY